MPKRSRKKTIIALTIMANLLVISGMRSFAEGVTVRAYGDFGVCLLPPDGLDLGYVAGSDNHTYIDETNSTYDLFEYGGGVQALYGVSADWKAGLDAGIKYGFGMDAAINSDLSLQQYSDDSYWADLCAVVERSGVGPFFVQAGAGLFLNIWTYFYYYDSNISGDTSSEASDGVKPKLGCFAAIGKDIPLRGTTKLFCSVRVDAILVYGLTLPVTACVGLSL